MISASHSWSSLCLSHSLSPPERGSVSSRQFTKKRSHGCTPDQTGSRQKKTAGRRRTQWLSSTTSDLANKGRWTVYSIYRGELITESHSRGVTANRKSRIQMSQWDVKGWQWEKQEPEETKWRFECFSEHCLVSVLPSVSFSLNKKAMTDCTLSALHQTAGWRSEASSQMFRSGAEHIFYEDETWTPSPCSCRFNQTDHLTGTHLSYLTGRQHTAGRVKLQAAHLWHRRLPCPDSLDEPRRASCAGTTNRLNAKRLRMKDWIQTGATFIRNTVYRSIKGELQTLYHTLNER